MLKIDKSNYSLYLISNKIPDIPDDPLTKLFTHSSLLGYQRYQIDEVHDISGKDPTKALEYLKSNYNPTPGLFACNFICDISPRDDAKVKDIEFTNFEVEDYEMEDID